ncbi:MAG: hypothetical protein ACRD36_12785 [Candidatus Acidiferrum sp.]
MNDDDYGRKEWARNIFSSKNSEDLLRDRAHKVLDGVFAATGLPEPPSPNREWCATSIYDIISARFRFKLRTPPGRLTELAVHAKKVKEHASQLVADLKSYGLPHPLRPFYDVATFESKGTPKMPAFSMGAGMQADRASPLRRVLKGEAVPKSGVIGVTGVAAMPATCTNPLRLQRLRPLPKK